MKIFFLITMFCVLFPAAVLAADQGIISKLSKYSVPETLDRLAAILKGKGVTIFCRINFSGDAQKVGLEMRPTQMLIFGNPKAGTPLMISAPSVALDLPLKTLAWEDDNGKVWLSFNSPTYLKQRHELQEEYMKNITVIEIFVDEALK